MYGKAIKIWLIFMFGVLVLSQTERCARPEPTQEDGSVVLKVVIADHSGLIPVNDSLGYAPVPAARAQLKSKYYYQAPEHPKIFTAKADSNGVAVFRNIPLGDYTLSVQKKIPVVVQQTGDLDSVTVRGSKLVNILDLQVVDTVQTEVARASDIVINELYYCGPKNKAHYFYDQFVELYNNSDSTRYLDGLILCRGLQKHKPNMDSVDYVQVIYIYQFPGVPKTGHDYPIFPHEFVVIAQDAIDHSQFVDTALDLSDADWEFYNPYYSEIDNPAPNVVNVIPDNSTDFMINLVHNDVILADGTGYYPGEVSDHGYQYYHVPLNTILDGVEYSANSTSQKELTVRVDAGFAGVGISKYSGKSVERRTPGFDTNNSSLDFIVLNHPTPGYSHGE